MSLNFSNKQYKAGKIGCKLLSSLIKSNILLRKWMRSNIYLPYKVFYYDLISEIAFISLLLHPVVISGTSTGRGSSAG